MARPRTRVATLLWRVPALPMRPTAGSKACSRTGRLTCVIKSIAQLWPTRRANGPPRLDAGELAFSLILASDDEPLAERADTLAQWCQGYLVGLAMAGIKDHNALPGDVPEFVNDLLKISQVTADSDGNDDETAFYELSEYIRVGVQLVFDELEPIRRARTVDEDGVDNNNKVH